MDINSNTDTHETMVGPTSFPNQITLHYFGQQTWGTCTSRVGSLDAIFQELQDEGINNVKIIAIGKELWNSGNSQWTNYNNIPVLVDPSPYNIWSSWGAEKRDLFFLDTNGNYYTHYNITPPTQVDGIKNTIYEMLLDLNIQSHPENISLLNAYPNPFNPSTNISFTISVGSHSIISIYDMRGRFLETLSKSYFIPGSYSLTWNASEYASGLYIIKLDNKFTTLSHKLILTK